jgi:hypothetical protein
MSGAKSLECTCGAVLQVRPEHAGPTVTCWQCGRHIAIPERRAPVSPGVVPITCQCGKTMNAHPSLAGKRVKCPGCGRALTVPSSSPKPSHADAARQDPLGVGSLVQDDPLGIGDACQVPRSPLGLSPALTAQGARAASAVSPSRADGRAGRSRVTLRDFAGWIALGFGGYQAVTSGYGLVRAYMFFLKSGTFGASPSALFRYVISGAICLILGVCLAVLGFQIVRRVNPRESLERAAQVSMVYIALFILGLVLSAIPLMRLFARSPTSGIVALVRIAFDSISFIPPAFIIYASSRRK